MSNEFVNLLEIYKEEILQLEALKKHKEESSGGSNSF